jgi:hypothetical protein
MVNNYQYNLIKYQLIYSFYLIQFILLKVILLNFSNLAIDLFNLVFNYGFCAFYLNGVMRGTDDRI